MLKTLQARLQKIGTQRLVSGGVVVAALVIAGGFWLSNAEGGLASECPVRPAAEAAIDAAAGGELAALLPTAGGRGYADMAFLDETGRPMTLADFAGKPLLVNFWATWCAPCREEMPALNALAARYAVEDFEVITINLDLGADGIEKARAFLEEENLPNLPLLADSTFQAFEQLKTNAVALGLPATLLLDDAACEIAVLQGPAEWDSPDAHKVIDALITVSTG